MFLLCILSDENQLDAMPVIKTTQYSWTKDSYRPLAYGRLAYVPDKGLLVDLQSFERDPVCSDSADILAGSCVALSIQCTNSSPVMTIALDAKGRSAVFQDGSIVKTELSADTYAGIDEQGWYWGVRFYIRPPLLPQLLGSCEFLPDQKLKGTIYKFSGSPDGDSHMGAAAPMTDRSIFSPYNLGDITVIRY